MSRAEQNQHNRALLLAAARRVFLERGYHAATLDQIADEAGFSKGVVYSQFDNKADMFLVLLEERIEERALENRRLVEDLSGEQGIALLRENSARRERAELAWWLLLIEFRVHAARVPELNRRYAAAHARTVQGIADIIEELYARAEKAPPLPPAELAQLFLTVSVGARLEQAVDPEGLSDSLAFELLAEITQSPTPSAAGLSPNRRVA